MELTGTLEERIAAALEFAKAHRAHEYDHDKFVERYHKAGVPYTEAAERFCREWDGVLDCCHFCKRNKSRCDFWFTCALDVTEGFDSPEEALQYWYDPETYEKDESWYPNYPQEIREKYGPDTVPVAAGGYYYFDIIWIKPDGSLIAILPDDGIEHYYGNLFDYLLRELGFAGTPDFVECDIEWKDLEGTMEERCAEAVGFAREHGGFEHCRLFPYNSGLDVIDLSEVIGDPQDPDLDALPARMSKYLTEYYDQVKYPGRTLQPGRINFVEE